MAVRLLFSFQYSRRELCVLSGGGDLQRRAVSVLVRHVGLDGLTDSLYDYSICVWRNGGIVIAFMGGKPTVVYARLVRDVSVDWLVVYSENVMEYVGITYVIRAGGAKGMSGGLAIVSCRRNRAEQLKV